MRSIQNPGCIHTGPVKLTTKASTAQISWNEGKRRVRVLYQSRDGVWGPLCQRVSDLRVFEGRTTSKMFFFGELYMFGRVEGGSKPFLGSCAVASTVFHQWISF